MTTVKNQKQSIDIAGNKYLIIEKDEDEEGGKASKNVVKAGTIVKGGADYKLSTQNVSLSPGLMNDTAMPVKKLLQGKAGKSGPKTKLSNMRTHLVYTTSSTSAATTAQFPVVGIDASSSSEFSNFQALYDEFKVHGFTAHVGYTNSSASAVGVQSSFGYDVLDANAVSSVASALEFSQHYGPVLWNGGPTITNVQPVSKTGFHIKRFKVPKGAAINSGATATGDEWVATGGTNIIFGVLKHAIVAATAGTTTVITWIFLDVEFRSRS
jgi:hypothetical protein